MPRARRYPFPSLPRGWFVVAAADEVEAGPPTTVHYFGQDIILFRTADGVVRALDAFCPHLGAHLGVGGCVEGDTIRCPYHGWRFSGDGRCIEIPGSDKIAGGLGLRSWPARESGGLIYLWHDAAGGAPTWEPPAVESEGWTPEKTVRWTLKTHPQEIFENTVDTAHLGPVHDAAEAELVEPLEITPDTLRAVIGMRASGAAIGKPEMLNDVVLDVKMYGLGHTVVHTEVLGMEMYARQRICATPIDEETTELRGYVSVKELEDETATEMLAQTFFDAFAEDFSRDFPIWENKAYLTRPRLSAADGPIPRYRKWAAGFYAAPQASEARAGDAGQPRRPDLRSRAIGAFDAVRAMADRYLGPALSRLSVLRGQTSAAPAPAARPAARPAPEVEPEADAEERRAARGRIASAADYFDNLPMRFAPSAARGLHEVFQWELTGDGGATWHAVVRDGAIELNEGPHPSPSVVVGMDAGDYVKLVNGELNQVVAFTTGRGRLRGQTRLAMKMRELFPVILDDPAAAGTRPPAGGG